MSDSEAIVPEKDSFVDVVAAGVTGIQYKLFLFIVLVFLIISNNVFIDRVLDNFSGAVENGVPTNKGTFIQAGMLLVGALSVECLIRNDVI